MVLTRSGRAGQTRTRFGPDRRLHNQSNDPTFDGTLEPIVKLALEGAGFISAYDRAGIRRSLGVRPPERLDEQAAQEIAVKQGVGVVLAGSLSRQGIGVPVTRSRRRRR